MRADFAFLDSGTGGIPYLLHLKEKAPRASCVYLADTKNFPYGEKSSASIIECASHAVSLIVERWQPKAVVIACNTISVTALGALRSRFQSTLFVGTVPAIKPAALVSKTGKIGVLATSATVNHPYTKDLTERFAGRCDVVFRADPALISFIERRAVFASEDEKKAALKPAVDFFQSSGCDVIVLACTHFLHIAREMQETAGDGITVIDSRQGVTRRALEITRFSEKSPFAAETPLPAPKRSLCALYVTGFNDERGYAEYENICRRTGGEFGGEVQTPPCAD
ncbi:MAG: glutamate racemase [Treponema sp.]